MTEKQDGLTEHQHMGIRPPAPGGSESQKWLKTKTAPTLRVNFRKINTGGAPAEMPPSLVPTLFKGILFCQKV